MMSTPPPQEPPTGNQQWGGTREMGPSESILWRMSTDPRLRSTIMAVEMLDTTPDWDRFLAAHEWGSRLIRRIRERVVEPPLHAGPPVWSVVPDFDVNDYVRSEKLPQPGSFRQLMDLAAEVYQTPFDSRRPPWEAVLVTGLADGRAAYLLKLHHAATDGAGFTQLLARLHSHTREPNPGKSQPPAPRPEGTTGTGLLSDRVVGAPGQAVHALGMVAGLVSRAVLHPDDTARGLRDYVASMSRILTTEGGPSSLLSGRSAVRRLEGFALPFEDLRSAAKAGGGSINDVFLAALGGGIGRYHRRFGFNPDIIPIGVPVSVRSDADAPGGNRFAAIRVPVPAAEPDPRERMRRIGAYVTAARQEPAIDALGLMTSVMAPLPSVLTRQANLALGRQLDVQASNVVGLRRQAYLAGARVTHIYPFAPCPGVAAMITLSSHDDVFCVGATLDVAAILEPTEFVECLMEGFDEVLAMRQGER